MGYCSFCNDKETEGWLKSYCKSCANLRRILILYDSEKCINILNRVLLRTDTQITNKINIELKRPVVSTIKKEIQEIKKADDKKDYDASPISTRSKNQKLN
tara:strand:- start:440 stop:742 length:303 start_codon:yes stop_codon:yes gene_type:complete